MFASLAKLIARAMAPIQVTTQPKIEMPPMVAKLAGSINTPLPIMLPATISVAATTPIFLPSLPPVVAAFSSSAIQSLLYLFGISS